MSHSSINSNRNEKRTARNTTLRNIMYIADEEKRMCVSESLFETVQISCHV